MTEQERLPLRFREDGGFTVLQIADVQDTQKTSKDTLAFLRAALDKERPDLAVLTGDQLKGYGLNFKGGDTLQKVAKAIDNIVSPLVERDIPFAVTFGNHDAQSGADKEQQLRLYQKYPQCVTPSPQPDLPGCGNMVLPIYSHTGDKPVFNLYIVDSLEYDKEMGGYAYVSSEQIAWCKAESAKLKAQNGGQTVPSLLFQHIPVPEMYEVLTKVQKGVKGAIRGSEGHRDYYILSPELIDGKSFLGENAAVPVKNNGQFDAWQEQGDILGAYFGHDHNNCFVGRYQGIDLGYTPGCGFHVYGPGLKRAVRVFQLNEKNPESYETYPVFYKDLFGRKVKDPFKCLLYTYAPSSVETAIPMIVKGVALSAGVAAAGVLLHLLKKRGGR